MDITKPVFLGLFILLIFAASCSKQDSEQKLSKEKPKPAFGTTAPTGHQADSK